METLKARGVTMFFLTIKNCAFGLKWTIPYTPLLYQQNRNYRNHKAVMNKIKDQSYVVYSQSSLIFHVHLSNDEEFLPFLYTIYTLP